MKEWTTGIMDALGYYGIALLMFLENIFPPIPSEIIMPAAGFTARQGQLNIWLVIVAGTAGSLLGALPWYYLGRWVGPECLKHWADRWGKWLTLRPADIDRAERWFDRWGPLTVLLCRMIPGVRTLISVPAGCAKMPLIPFLLYSLIGTAMWTALLAWIGWLLRDNYEVVSVYLGPVSAVVLGALVFWAAWWVIQRRRRARRLAAAPR